jgi:ATP:cob(I)alamin adenosyltransferase
MKPGKNRAELCCSHIYDVSWLADYEVLTDELCAQLGMACSTAEVEFPDLAADLATLQPLVLHANGSIRGHMAVTEADLDWLAGRYAHYCAQVPERLKTFVLPRGTEPVPLLHLARSGAKKAIRALVRLEGEGREIPPILPRFLNLLCNFCFTLTVVVNQRRGVSEPIFISKSYGRALQLGKTEKVEED